MSGGAYGYADKFTPGATDASHTLAHTLDPGASLNDGEVARMAYDAERVFRDFFGRRASGTRWRVDITAGALTITFYWLKL